MQYLVVNSSCLASLIKTMDKYKVDSLSSLAISNGNYYQAFIGELKVEPKEDIPVPIKKAPTTRKPRKPRATKVKE